MGSNLNKCLFFLIISCWLLTQGLASYRFVPSQKDKIEKGILAAEERAHEYYKTEVQSESTKILGGDRTELIGKLLSQPMAMLTWNDAYEPCAPITFKNVKQCIQLEKIASKCAWKFVNTFGTCVRLFVDISCAGESIAIYPGSNYSLSIVNPYYKKAYSIGPCFETEFDSATFYKTSKLELVARKDMSDARSVPDLFNTTVDLAVNETLHERLLGYADISIYLTTELQVKLVYDFMTPKNHPQPTPNNITYLESSPGWSRMHKREGDRLGFIIPTSLSGPGDDTSNIFPQGREHYRKWKEVTDAAVTYLERHPDSWIRFYVGFDYYNGTESFRPWRTYYHLVFGRSKGQEYFIKYNFILNE